MKNQSQARNTDQGLAKMTVRTDGSFSVNRDSFFSSKQYVKQIKAARSLAESILGVSNVRKRK